MKTKHILIIIALAIFLIACGNSEKKEGKTTLEETKTEVAKPSKENSIDLKQKGDYTRLYALNDGCKITIEEVATLYGISTDEIKLINPYEDKDGGYSCTFKFSLKDGTETVLGVTSFKMPKPDVQSQIFKWKTNSYEKDFLKVSNSGDHYFWKHPNQGWFQLHNPNYANGIRLRYRTMFKLTKTQSEHLEQKGIHAIDYLIEKYKD